MFSWYHEDWDIEPDPPSSVENVAEQLLAISDYHYCVWPEELRARDSESDRGRPSPIGQPGDGGRELASWFAKLNEPALMQLNTMLPPAAEAGREPPHRILSEQEVNQRYGLDDNTYPGLRILSHSDREVRRGLCRPPMSEDVSELASLGFESLPAGAGRPFVISFSHFVPRQCLLPEKRMLSHGALLPKISGSTFLEEQIRRLMPDVHIFGHTHIPVDVTLEGVRYIQWPLGNPREQATATRTAALGGLMCIYDATEGGEAPEHWTWSAQART